MVIDEFISFLFICTESDDEPRSEYEAGTALGELLWISDHISSVVRQCRVGLCIIIKFKMCKKKKVTFGVFFNWNQTLLWQITMKWRMKLANHNATEMRAASGAGKRTGANSNSIRLVENLAVFLRPASLVSQKCTAIKKLPRQLDWKQLKAKRDDAIVYILREQQPTHVA